jgi:hypothetical protein
LSKLPVDKKIILQKKWAPIDTSEVTKSG